MILKSKDLKSYRNKLNSIRNNIDLFTGKPINKPCLDHDHKTGYCREVLDFNSNQFLGKIESARRRYLYKLTDSEIPEVLRKIADYLEKDYSQNPLHPKYISIKIKRYSRLTKAEQDKIYKAVGKTSLERTKAYRKHLMDPKNIYKI